MAEPDAHRFDMEIDRDLVMGGFGSVCPDHCEDESLKQWIERNAEEATCSYCDREGAEPFAADLGRFTEHVFRSLLLEYGGADDEGTPYDSGEGGYQAPILDTYDILVEEGLGVDADLLADLVECWHGQPWISRDTWWLTEDQAMTYGWSRFREIVLHERRYWFHLAGPDPYEPSAVPPGRMLPAVGAAIEAADLVRTVSPGARIFRAQTHRPDERLEGAQRLGSPPPEKAVSNRMSPAGIPIFYGADDAATACAEVRAAETDPERTAVTTGVFAATRELRLVDLSETLALPGLFDEEGAPARPAIRFLGDFADEVSRRVLRDGAEHVEYVPTQVLAEWLRFEFNPDGQSVDGLRYRSAQGSGSCVALFLGPESAAEQHATPAPTQPLQHVETIACPSD